MVEDCAGTLLFPLFKTTMSKVTNDAKLGTELLLLNQTE